MKRIMVYASSAAFAAALAGAIGCGGSGCGGGNNNNNSSSMTAPPNYICGAGTTLVNNQCVAPAPSSAPNSPAAVKHITN